MRLRSTHLAQSPEELTVVYRKKHLWAEAKGNIQGLHLGTQHMPYPTAHRKTSDSVPAWYGSRWCFRCGNQVLVQDSL